MEGKMCAYCGDRATHFCSGCGNWICDRALCVIKGAAKTLGIPVNTLAERNTDAPNR